MPQKLYRIRSIRHLLGEHQELRQQQIYFAEPNELNDPMEGFRDTVWRGDEIVWTNLFRNFISTLNLTVTLVRVCGADRIITPEEVPIEGLSLEHPTPMETEILDELCSVVFERCQLMPLVTSLAATERTVRRDELTLYLRGVHYIAFEEIQKLHDRLSGFSENAANRQQLQSPSYLSKLPEVIYATPREPSEVDSSITGTLFSIANLEFDNRNLIRKYHGRERASTDGQLLQPNQDLIILDFPKTYISQLQRILYPKWYVACFFENLRNSSLWGHYGENHTGACLIFKARHPSGRLALPLKCKVGNSSIKDRQSSETITSTKWDFIPIAFHKIDYHEKPVELDFFRSIGRLNKQKLMSQWYTDRDGNRSQCSDHIGTDTESSWRDTHWKRFYRDITVKTRHWSYEEEWRLILSSSLNDLSDASDRTLSYRFSSLEGIVFGINMSDAHKMEVIQIILEKCRQSNRALFDFYQAYYSHEKNSVEILQLDVKILP